ncbi:MAG: hypothetical protein WD601_13705 [Pseudohongiellaceae bacterium]
MDSIDPQELRALTRRIISSGELGRSKTYAAILEYLVECSISGDTPKEMAIAVDVLGREADFDVGKDSIVRVHIYHLRNKLNAYYRKHGKREKYRLEIPKGQYLITTVHNEGRTGTAVEEPEPAPSRHTLTPWLAGLAALLIVTQLVFMLAGQEAVQPHSEVLSQSPWQAMMDDQTPILVVVGDYFIFGEIDERGNVERMVREFDINSERDLENLFMTDPELTDTYYNLGLTYTPNGVTTALLRIMPLLYQQTHRLSLKMMSDLSAADLISNHVIYLGYISGLGILEDLMFAASNLETGATFDELRNRQTNEVYFSDSGILNTASEYRDFGMISSFPSPRGNQFILIAGMRDAGLQNLAAEISEAESLANLNDDLEGQPPAWEALYEVYGFDHTNIDARLVYAGALEPRRIWGGEF